MAWHTGEMHGRVVAGGNGEGNSSNQLNRPVSVVVDPQTDELFICDRWNRRIVSWPVGSPNDSGTAPTGKIIIEKIDCSGLTMDKHGSLYVGDVTKHEVRRYDNGNFEKGVIVAGGHGAGSKLNQVAFPISLFVDEELNLYVSELRNRRVTKWTREAWEGVEVAGHQHRKAADGINLAAPSGIWVDQCQRVYVADAEHDRVLLWKRGDHEGTVVVGSEGSGSAANQLSNPNGLYFDNHGSLYIADQWNHRIQRFSLIQ